MEIDSTFYIARTLTTVAQYERFVAANGYELGETIWGRAGIAWLKALQNEKRAETAQRRAPRRWGEQRAHQHRPVTDITWFEARAYAAWLSGQMRGELDAAGLEGYAARLPTEPQWERAARAKDLNAAHTGLWPWGDDKLTAAQQANVEGSKIERASTVGVFAPNAIGLHDIAGNAWEWMDNRYEQSRQEAFKRISPAENLTNERSDAVSLRGGSWLFVPENASCSYRLRLLPVNSDLNIGVRVVLSLA